MQFDNLILEWKGHSCFFILSSELKIYIDPYKLSPGSSNYKADIILITHPHYDHCSIEDLRKIVKDDCIIIIPAGCQSKLAKLREKINIKIIEPGNEIEVKGIKIRAVPSYNINKNFHSKQEYWNGYIIEIEGKKIYHAGDTDLIPEMSYLANSNIDIALLPVDGVYNMSSQEAIRAAILIRPKFIIPMHYGSVVGTREDALKFQDLCEQEGIKCEILEKV